MITSILCALIGLLQVAKVLGVVETIYCPHNLDNTQYQLSPNLTLLISNSDLMLNLRDDFKFYMRDASTVDITVYNMLASMKADMSQLDLLKQQASPLSVKYVEYNYEVLGFARRVQLDEDYSELHSFRIVTMPYNAFDIYYMPESFKHRLQKEIESCLELQMHFELGRIHKSKFLQLPNYIRGCTAPEFHHTLPPTAHFQNVINKVADIVTHKIIEEFVDPLEGQIEAPELSVEYRQYLFLTGTFKVSNGTMRDLRTIKRRSNIVISRNEQFLTISGSFEIKDVSITYKNYQVTGAIRSTGNNVTLSFEDVILHVIVHIDTNEFPCGIKLHQLKVTSNGSTEIKIIDASSPIKSSVKNEFVKQKTVILKKFGDKFREYIESQMDWYDCKAVQVLHFLEKPLKTFLSTSNVTGQDNALNYNNKRIW